MHSGSSQPSDKNRNIHPSSCYRISLVVLTWFQEFLDSQGGNEHSEVGDTGRHNSPASEEPPWEILNWRKEVLIKSEDDKEDTTNNNHGDDMAGLPFLS